MIVKTLHNIDTFATNLNETILVGRDEHGEDFKLAIPTFELLEWLDIQHMKKTTIDYIENLQP